jgi:hypothetical protein
VKIRHLSGIRGFLRALGGKKYYIKKSVGAGMAKANGYFPV